VCGRSKVSGVFRGGEKIETENSNFEKIDCRRFLEGACNPLM
jgi:hypothetical protein